MALNEAATGIMINTDSGISLYKRSVNLSSVSFANSGVLQAFVM
jgi:hypothetical protein